MKFRKCVWFMAGVVLLVLACSDAPVVPVTPTNRVVLGEMIAETG